MNKLIKKIILSDSKVFLKTFELNNISKKYIDRLNDKKINKFLEVRKVRQNKKTVTKYILDKINDPNKHMFQIKKKNKFIGTATLNIRKRSYCYLGYMISDSRSWGTEYSVRPFKLIVKYIFKNLKVKKIVCTTLVQNIGIAIFLKKIGFQKLRNISAKNLYNKLFNKTLKNNTDVYILKK